MGNNSQRQVQTADIKEAAEKSVDSLFALDFTLLTIDVAEPLIHEISYFLKLKGSFKKEEDGFQANPILLKLVFNPKFQDLMKGLISTLLKSLKACLQVKLNFLVSRQSFQKCLNLANFCIYFTNDEMIEEISLLHIRSDLHAQTKKHLDLYSQHDQQLKINLFSTFDTDALIQTTKCIRLAINKIIELHLKLLSRSDFTMQIIDHLNSSLFVLYSRLYFNTNRLVSKKQTEQNHESLVRMSAYFIGVGLDQNIPSIYEISVFLLGSLLNFKEFEEDRALPSHLFKSIPLVTTNDMTQWIVCELLYSLKYIEENGVVYCRLNINRIPTLQLLDTLFRKKIAKTKQITFMLEEICLQTKAGQVDRVYVADIASHYISYNDSENSISEIIKKFAETRNINFNIKKNNRHLKVRPEDVMTELENDDQVTKKEIVSLCSKFIVKAIFHKKDIIYEYSDKALWNLILEQFDGEEGDERKAGKHERDNKPEKESISEDKQQCS